MLYLVLLIRQKKTHLLSKSVSQIKTGGGADGDELEADDDGDEAPGTSTRGRRSGGRASKSSERLISLVNL